MVVTIVGKGMTGSELCEPFLWGRAKVVLGSVPCRGFAFNKFLRRSFATFCIDDPIIYPFCVVCVDAVSINLVLSCALRSPMFSKPSHRPYSYREE